MLDSLEASLSAMGDSLTCPDFEGIDNASGLNLHRPLAHCKHWLEHMNSLLQGLRKKWASTIAAIIRENVDTLEKAIPRWDTILEQRPLDESFAKGRLLDNPKRPLVKPCVIFLRSSLSKLVGLESRWGIGASLDAPTKRFIESTANSGSHYLTIVAALNTIVNFKTSHRAPAMAEEVVAIVKKKSAETGFVCPEVVMSTLRSMASGEGVAGNNGPQASVRHRASASQERASPALAPV